MKRAPGPMERLSQLSCYAAGFGAVVMMLLIFIAVVMRYVFKHPFTFTEEVTGYLVLFVVFMGLAYTLVTDGHIRTDLLLKHLPPSARRAADVLSGLVALVWSVVLLVSVGRRAFDYWVDGTRSFTGLKTPLWIPSLFMVLGTVLLVGQLLVWVVDAVRGRSVDLDVQGGGHV